jgi:hypothetical protein
MSSLATTPGNALVIPVSSTTGVEGEVLGMACEPE